VSGDEGTRGCQEDPEGLNGAQRASQTRQKPRKNTEESGRSSRAAIPRLWRNAVGESRPYPGAGLRRPVDSRSRYHERR
jgi:hypothetical protein